MSDTIYKVIEGVSDVSWEDAARKALERTSRTLVDLESVLRDGKILEYRVVMKLTFIFK